MTTALTFENIAELRRITEAIEQLRDSVIHAAELRSDCRQMRLALSDGRTLLVSVLLEDSGRPRLDVDVLQAPSVSEQAGQLEVHFDGQS